MQEFTKIKYITSAVLLCGTMSISGCDLLANPQEKEINSFVSKAYSPEFGKDKSREVGDREFVSEKMKLKADYEAKSQKFETQSNLERSKIISRLDYYSLSGDGARQQMEDENKVRNLMADSLGMKKKSLAVSVEIEERQLSTLNDSLLKRYQLTFTPETFLLLERAGFPDKKAQKGTLKWESVFSALENEPLCSCNNLQSLSRKVDIKATGPHTATAKVIFFENRQSQNPSTEVTLSLVNADKVWKIDDILYPDGSQFKKLFVKK